MIIHEATFAGVTFTEAVSFAEKYRVRGTKKVAEGFTVMLDILTWANVDAYNSDAEPIIKSRCLFGEGEPETYNGNFVKISKIANGKKRFKKDKVEEAMEEELVKLKDSIWYNGVVSDHVDP